ncbi:MAG TPA: hypothetical protein VGV69_04830 [Solirubrobacterales bacterium]|nr:hypothetical protein [Solirubrobacterales bacterium]
MSDAPQGTGSRDDRPPRGALIVIAVGLVACLVAALATVGKGEGEAANLEWVQKKAFADSRPVPIAGGKGEIGFVDTGIYATGTNVSGYMLSRVGSSLRVSGGSPIGGGRVLCTVTARKGTEIARSSGGLRATYPRSSDGGIYNQEVPETVLIDFSSHGNELASLEVPERPQRFTTERGVKLEWPEYKTGTERLKYFIVGKPKQDLVLPFFTVWKGTAIPAADIACTLKTSAGSTTVRTKAALAKASPPIDEEAEELKAEEREEQEEAEEEGDEG